MNPTSAAKYLRIIASKIDASKSPDPKLVRKDLQRVLVAIEETKVSPTDAPKKGLEITNLEGELTGGSGEDAWKCKVDWIPGDLPDVEPIKGNPPDPEALQKAIRINASNVTPTKIASELRAIASKIDKSINPNKTLVAAALQNILRVIQASGHIAAGGK